MPTIALRFPGGRFHATAWGSHVNEGQIEWPPSPWRLLRALLAVGFTKSGWMAVPDDAKQLVEALASVTPQYRLPDGLAAHTRHYMPVIEGKKQGTTKVLDTFVRLDSRSELIVDYPVHLEVSLRDLLGDLIGGLTYLGRAESWVDARLIDDAPVAERRGWCVPDAIPGPGEDQMALLTPVSVDTHAAWREPALARAVAEAEHAAIAAGRTLSKAQRLRLESSFPLSLLECLLADTAVLQAHGWSQPPGARRVFYTRPSGTLEPRSNASSSPMRRRKPVNAVLLAFASDTKRGRLLPLLSRCLPHAELLHRFVISRLGEEARLCPALSGRDIDGSPLRGHGHAHYLPLDLNEDGRIDHVIVHASMGLDQRAQSAISRVTHTPMKGSDTNIMVSVVGAGELAIFRRQVRTKSGRPLGVIQAGMDWVSVTPLVAPRHLKRHRHSLEDQVVAELRARSLPEPVTIERLSTREIVDRQFLRFVRARRQGKPQPPSTQAFGLRLRFPVPIQGPLALGYASHYGLGLFELEERPSISAGMADPAADMEGIGL